MDAKTNEQKLLEGHPNKQRIKNTPQAKGKPIKPRGLRGEALKLWNSIVPELDRLGVVTEIDTPQLTAMAEWWGLYRKAVSEEDIHNANKAWTNFNKLADAFGLTPKGRNTVQVSATKEDDLDSFLGAK